MNGLVAEWIEKASEPGSHCKDKGHEGTIGQKPGFLEKLGFFLKRTLDQL